MLYQLSYCRDQTVVCYEKRGKDTRFSGMAKEKAEKDYEPIHDFRLSRYLPRKLLLRHSVFHFFVLPLHILSQSEQF